MLKGIKVILITAFLTLRLFFLSFAEESITITTYYPSPYGSYNELYVANNVGIGTSQPNALLDVAGSTRLQDKIRLSGQEHYAAGNTDTNGMALWLGVNRTGNRQLWFVDSASAVNNSTAALRVLASASNNYGSIDTVSTDGTTYLNTVINVGGGNVGIAISSPTAKLHVNGNIKAVLSDIDGGSPANMRYNSGTNEIGYDVAELFETNEEVEPADVLSIDDNGKLKKSSKPYDSRVAGVVSESPAILFEGSQLQIAPQPFEFKKGNKPPLALAGRVKCKVTTQAGGPIKVGDLLVTSDKAGYAMKADYNKLRFGVILGKALESLDSGDGKVNVLVTLE